MHPALKGLASRISYQEDLQLLEEFSAYVQHLEFEMTLFGQFEQYIYMSLMGLKESRDGSHLGTEAKNETQSSDLHGPE